MFTSYSRIAGFLHDEPIFEDGLTSDILCNDYFVVYREGTPDFIPFKRQRRCAYCGRAGDGHECNSCGAPFGGKK